MVVDGQQGVVTKSRLWGGVLQRKHIALQNALALKDPATDLALTLHLAVVGECHVQTFLDNDGRDFEEREASRLRAHVTGDSKVRAVKDVALVAEEGFNPFKLLKSTQVVEQNLQRSLEVSVIGLEHALCEIRPTVPRNFAAGVLDTLDCVDNVTCESQYLKTNLRWET